MQLPSITLLLISKYNFRETLDSSYGVADVCCKWLLFLHSFPVLLLLVAHTMNEYLDQRLMKKKTS